MSLYLIDKHKTYFAYSICTVSELNTFKSFPFIDLIRS